MKIKFVREVGLGLSLYFHFVNSITMGFCARNSFTKKTGGMLPFSKYMYVLHDNIEIKLIDALFPPVQQQKPSLFPPCKCKLHAGSLFLSFCPLRVWEAHTHERGKGQMPKCLQGQWVIVSTRGP